MAYNQAYSSQGHAPQNRYYNESANADFPPPLPQDQGSYGNSQQSNGDSYGYNIDGGAGYEAMGNPYGDIGNPYNQPSQPQPNRGPPQQAYNNPRPPHSAPPRNAYPPPQNGQRPQQYPPQQYPPQQRGRSQPPGPGRRGPPPPHMYQNGNMPPPGNMRPNGPMPPQGRMPPPNGFPMPRPGPGMQDDRSGRARSQSRGRQAPGGNRPPDMYGYNEPGPYGGKPMMPQDGRGQSRPPQSRGRDGAPPMPMPPRTESRPGSSRRPMDDLSSPQTRNADNPFPSFPGKGRGDGMRPNIDPPRPNFDQQSRPSMDRPRPDFDRPRPSFGDRARPSMDQNRPSLPQGVSNSSLTNGEIYNGIVHDYARDQSQDRGGPQRNNGQFALPDRSGRPLPSAPGIDTAANESVPLTAANNPWSGGSFPEYYEEDDRPEVFEMAADPVAVELPANENGGGYHQPPPIQRSRTASPGPAGQGGPVYNPALHRAGFAGSHGSFYSDPGVGNGPRPMGRGQGPPGQGPPGHPAYQGQGQGMDPRRNQQQMRPGQAPPVMNGAFPRPGMQDRGYSSDSQKAAGPNRNGIERPDFYQGQSRMAQQPPRVPQPTSPDALPHHATPLESNGPQSQSSTTSPPAQQPSKPPPVRQYDSNQPNAAGGRRPSEPAVTSASLAKLEELARANPNDNPTQLKLVRAYVEASTTLTGSDPKARAAASFRYNSLALKLLKSQVAKSDAEAIFFLADCYGDGRCGLEIDPKEAFTLYQNSAKLGHAAAAYRTAVCCEIGPDEGGGTRKDPLKAFQWYKRAATLGDVPAMYKMGIILLKGLLGQEKSPDEAVDYLRRATAGADAENPHALHELALLYENPPPGGAIAKDEPQALKLFEQAAKLGYKYAQFKLGQAYEYGLLGCPIRARDSIIWYTKAAAQGEHQSELALSGWYLTGSEGILECSDTEAYLWARKAASANPPLPKAMFAMGYFTEVGIGCPRSLEEAKRWYARAASYRFPKAQERLDELRKGGVNALQSSTSSAAGRAGAGGAAGGGGNVNHRDKLTRKDHKKDESECAVM